MIFTMFGKTVRRPNRRVITPWFFIDTKDSWDMADSIDSEERLKKLQAMWLLFHFTKILISQPSKYFPVQIQQ